MAIILVDDGTLDTVLKCTLCQEKFRGSYLMHVEGLDIDDTYDEYVDWLIDDTMMDHECPETKEIEP